MKIWRDWNTHNCQSSWSHFVSWILEFHFYRSPISSSQIVLSALLSSFLPTHICVYILTRVHLRFEFHVPHQILYTTLAIDEKWPLSRFHISYQNSKISWQKMDTFFENKVFFKYSKKKNWTNSADFDLEKWLWKYEFGIFRQLLSEFW